MRLVASLVHLLSGGLVLSVSWLAAAIFYAPFSATRPIARLCLQVAFWHLDPFGKELVHEADLQKFRDYLRTGQVERRRIGWRIDGETVVQAALWLPAGIVLAAAHLAHGLFTSLLTVSNPWRSLSFAMVGPALLPLGWQVVPVSPARARLAPRPRRPLPRITAPRRRPINVRRVARSLGATTGSAVLVLWASYSATGPLMHAAGGGRGAGAFAAVPHVQTAMPSDLYRVRPQANPPVPVGWAPARVSEERHRCGAPAAQPAELRLARRHRDFALPIGASQIRAAAVPADAERRLKRVQALAVSRAHSKIAGPPCLDDLAKQALRSASLAARKAEAERLAAKAEPDIILASLGPSPMVGEAKKRQRLDGRHMQNIGRLAGLLSPAKARDAPDRGEAAARIARTGRLRQLAGPATSGAVEPRQLY